MKKEGKGITYCRYGFPRNLLKIIEDILGHVQDDPLRKDLRNLLLERNDTLLNNFEEHLLLMNLGNIDWRALLNLWSVLEYLTKYNAKAGKGSKHLGKLFEDVLSKVYDYEEEDGMHDLWRRTTMKFYSRILGDRDYSLFEVVHFGLRLPGSLSSFGPIESVSVSQWSGIKHGQAFRHLKPGDRATWFNKLEIFNHRAEYQRAATITDADLSDISFYAFWRMYYVQGNKLIRRRIEKIVALNGTGWPAQACRTHPKHTNYAQRTLYAYMPCAGVRGTDYIDAVVNMFYNNDWTEALSKFVNDPPNAWCPPWIRRNYEIRNKDLYALPTQASTGPSNTNAEDAEKEERFPHAGKSKPTFIFEDTGEPPIDEEDPERPEAYETDYHWNPDHRPTWQRHSELGPNLNPEGIRERIEPLPDIVNPLDHSYAEAWHQCNIEAWRSTWETLRTSSTVYSDPKKKR